MKTLILTSFVAIALLLGSCKKLLDVKPKDFITPETYFNKEADATAVLGSAWDMLTRQWMYSGYYQCRMLVADDVYTTLSPTNPGYAATLSLGASDATAFPLRWNNLYSAIQYCNLLLANLPKINMDETRKGVLRGEGLFLRAFLYYELVIDWGPVPLRLVPTAGPDDLNIAGTPMKDIYIQIIKDMTEAEALVPTTASSLYGGAGYAAKTTVEAMLARVCLSMAGEPINDVSQYQAAKNWAQKVVDSHEHALNPDYTQVFKNLASGNIDKKESLWEVDYNYITGAGEHGYLGYLNGIPGASFVFAYSVGQMKITRKLFNAYGGTPASTKDLRRDWNCGPYTYKNTTTTGAESDKTYYTTTQLYDRPDAKYRLEYAPKPLVNATSSINFPLMRYSDVLLMLAEAENYINGPTELAYSSINQVRARAYGKLMPGATNLTEADLPRIYDKAGLLQQIQDERLREFSSEATRKQDLVRWGIYVSTIKALGADVNNTSLPAVVAAAKNSMNQLANIISNRDLLWPMPASEMQYNKLLKQNAGW